MKKNQEKFNEDIKLKYKDLYEVLGEYNDRHTKVKIKCKVCGEGHYRPINYNGISDEEALNNFEKLKLRDNIKNKYCEENSIKLIRIPYYSIKNIKNLVESFIKDIVLTT